MTIWVMQSELETAVIADHLVYSGSLGFSAVQGDKTKDETESLQASATSSPIDEFQSVNTESQDKNNKDLHTPH